MVERPVVDVSRLVPVLAFLLIAMFLLAVGSLGSMYALFAAGTLIGAGLGLAVFWLRSGEGLGASPASEPEPSRSGSIDISHVPVIGIGGLGLVAMAVIVALDLPSGRQLVTWGLSGGLVGAAAVLMWRHLNGASPFGNAPKETLHLR